MKMGELARLADAGGPNSRGVIAAPRASAAWNLKKLSPKHRQIASLYVTGLDRESIAQLVGCTPALITMLLGQSVFVDFVKDLQSQLAHDMQAMQAKAIRAVDRALDPAVDTKDQLRAADMVFRANGTYQDAGKQGATAEDIVAKLLQINAEGGSTVNVQVNVGANNAELE